MVFSDPPLSIILPTLDAAAHLPAALDSLDEGRRAGLLREVLVADGGSRDETCAVARAWGARVIAAPQGRGAQLATGAAAASGDWLFFLHADTRLAAGWTGPVERFMAGPASRESAAYLRFRLDDEGQAARRLEAMVAWRCRAFGLPYGDQGLLVSRGLYERSGGFRPLPLMEDVDLARRLGAYRLAPLPVDAVTSAARYRRGGYVARSLRNLACLGLYFVGVPPALIARLYG